MATTFSSLAMRAAAASACFRPSSERWRPRARPGSFTPVVGVRPWRTRRTMVEGGGFLSFIARSGMPSHPAFPPPPVTRVLLDPSPPSTERVGVRVIPRPPTLPTAPGVLHGLPDAPRRGGALAQHHVEIDERILDGVDNGRRARDGAALSHSLDAEWVDDRAVLGQRHVDRGHIVALGNGVVHEAARQELTRLVVHELFEKSGGQALDGAALELPFHDH